MNYIAKLRKLGEAEQKLQDLMVHCENGKSMKFSKFQKDFDFLRFKLQGYELTPKSKEAVAKARSEFLKLKKKLRKGVKDVFYFRIYNRAFCLYQCVFLGQNL